MTLTYAYCIVRSARRPALRGVPPGVPGGAGVRALEAGGGVWLIVSTVPASEYDEAALGRGLQNLDWVGRRAMAHEAVVEHFLTAAAVLPMQLFTLFTSDARALAHVARDRRRIDRILTRLDRQHEWGLRLTFDEKAVTEAVHQKQRGERGRRKGGITGTAYLARKRDLLGVTKVEATRARKDADRLFRLMRAEATDTLRRKEMEASAPGSRLLLDAAFLVPSRRSGAFRTALRKHAKQLGTTGIVISLTGPWPPYNFIDR